jgi:hypothetical protein
MIRHIVLIRCTADAPADLVERIEEDLNVLDVDGRIAVAVLRDAGMRSTSMDFAVISDFVDAASYEAYEAHPAHRKIRDEVLAPYVVESARIQLRLAS